MKDSTALCTETISTYLMKVTLDLSFSISIAKTSRKTILINKSHTNFLPVPFSGKCTLKYAHKNTSQYAGDV